jgi:hypothetical protein
MLGMFVADTEEHLDSSRLYAAKWNQTSKDGTDGGEAGIEWVDLDHARSEDIRKVIDHGITFQVQAD